MGKSPRSRDKDHSGLATGTATVNKPSELHKSRRLSSGVSRPGISPSSPVLSVSTSAPQVSSQSSDELSDAPPEIADWGDKMDLDRPIKKESAEKPSAIIAPIIDDRLRTSRAAHRPLGTQVSLESSLSAMSDVSELSSLPSSPRSSKATTPVEGDAPRIAPTSSRAHGLPPALSLSPPPVPLLMGRLITSGLPRPLNVRPKSSIPADMSWSEYATQCLEAAESSRLHPYALHAEEYRLLRDHITYPQVTTYLNIRNSILRLWCRNPRVAVTREEAVGCASARWADAASVCFDWLVRNGYINYGCVEIGSKPHVGTNLKRRTVVVIGAGMSGLGCARQLEGLFKQYAERFFMAGEAIPKVLVLEGRSRIGGRVYSREFRTKPPRAAADPFRGERHTAEMGGMIITGFERGNPMNILVRAQLGLPYHVLLSDTTIYDSDGKAVDEKRDLLVEELYNDCLERASEFKWKQTPLKLVEGNRDLMNEAKDCVNDGQKTIRQADEATAVLMRTMPLSQQSVVAPVSMVPVSSDKATGKVHNEPGTPAKLTGAQVAKSHGWDLKPGVSERDNINLKDAAEANKATLGSVLDEAITQYKKIVDLDARDFRLLNWHVANLEYSNATNLHNLSLGGWDIDAGNEWEGRHTMVVGGYQTVPRGLLRCPASLNLKTSAPVRRIVTGTDPSGSGWPSARIVLENSEIIDANYVVSTIPLGVLKQGSVEFIPRLPSWKTEAIARLGWGVLNKVVLVYNQKDVFWDTSRDIFGVLRDATSRRSISQEDYSSNRGRFFQWFNVSNTTGLPCLVALMAGDAAFETEHTSNEDLVAEATEVLRSVFGARVPPPVEAVVTRWGSDRFARGSYSSSGPEMQADDYDTMARRVDNIFFAGEHTIATHPATVHGAYLSGLRAASEILESILGPIEVPTPLILSKESVSQKRKEPSEPKDRRQARLDAYENAAWDYIRSKIGERPWCPPKLTSNPYLVYSRAQFDNARQRCEENRRPGKRKAKAAPNEVRVMMAKMWKEATPEERKPYEDQAAELKRQHAEAVEAYKVSSTKWDDEAKLLRAEYEKEHPYVPGPGEIVGDGASPSKQRRTKNVSYTEDDSEMEF